MQTQTKAFTTSYDGKYFLLCSTVVNDETLYTAFALSANDAIRADAAGIHFGPFSGFTEDGRRAVTLAAPFHSLAA